MKKISNCVQCVQYVHFLTLSGQEGLADLQRLNVLLLYSLTAMYSNLSVTVKQ